jgi:preprotein translocase subunit SecG
MLLGILLTILIIVCVLLITVILMQRSEGGALGMGGGGGGGFLSTRGTADLLTRTTQILGFVFFVLCLAIVVVTGRAQRTGGLVDKANIGKIDAGLLQKQAPPPAQPAPQPDNGFQAPLPSIGGAPNPPAQAPFGAPASPAPPTK